MSWEHPRECSMVRSKGEVTNLGHFLLCHRDCSWVGLLSCDCIIKHSAPFPPATARIMLFLLKIVAIVMISKADLTWVLISVYFSCQDSPESVPHTDKNTFYCPDNSYFIVAYGRCTMVSLCRCASLVRWVIPAGAWGSCGQLTSLWRDYSVFVSPATKNS